MFEFGFPTLLLIGVLGAVAWHLYATKVLGYKSAGESDLHKAFAALEERLTGKHATLSAELKGLHDVSHTRLTSIEQLVTPAASAGVTAAAIPAAAAAPAPAAPATPAA